MSDARGNPVGQRDRSPSFPFIPLKTAIERLSAFEEHHKRAPVPPDRVGPSWGMKTNTSQAQQTLAALRAYGLLETRLTPEGRRVVISEDGRIYLRAQQDSVKQEVLRRAALRPKQIQKYWHDWGRDRSKDAACLDALVVHGGGFSEDGAEKFLKVYDETIAYAGLLESDKKEPDETEGMAEGFDASEREVSDPPEPQMWKPAPVARGSGRIEIMEGERVVFTEESDPQRYVKLIASGDIDETLLDALSAYVDRQRKRLEGRVTKPSDWRSSVSE
jgi:hypothetical protein